MQKFITSAITLPLVFFLCAAAYGIQNNSHFKIVDMPQGLRYHITVNAGIWPDQFYASSYDMPQPRSLYFNGYWTFEPSKYPFGGPVWTYHTNELTLTDVDFVVNQITG